MSRPDCISNRNIKIIAAYTKSKTGTLSLLFEGLTYPEPQYSCAEEYFLNEDEWTTFENFEKIFRRAKKLVGEPYFYFNCGASSARFGSWGRFHYFLKVFASPDDGFKRLPYFNKNFNDTKEINLIHPPKYDSHTKKMQVILQVIFHQDFDPNRDYFGDPYLRGILSAIPTLWGLAPAWITQPLNPYDPVRLLNEDPDFAHLQLDPQLEKGIFTVRDPDSGQRVEAGLKITLVPEQVNGQSIFLGRYVKIQEGEGKGGDEKDSGLLITRTVKDGQRIILKKGEIFMAPYSILKVSYERFSLSTRLRQIFNIRRSNVSGESELFETINQLRETISAKNEAYRLLEQAHGELSKTKARLELYTQRLEEEVRERTKELEAAHKQLEKRVEAQVRELERLNELRRYLPPRLAEKILMHGGSLSKEFKRKFMTVVFTDIRNFSNITDSLEAEEIFQLLNRYLAEMVEIIHKWEGTLNKVMGDGLVVLFGDPIEMEDHATRAVLMAIEMQRKVKFLKKEWEDLGHSLGIGIGINTGYMTVGTMGSELLKDYTVIGNQVNIAARIEAIAGPGQILITHRTYRQLKGDMVVEPFDEVTIKGIHSPVKLYIVKVD